MWVIEEYAIIVRKCDWFIPKRPPNRAFILAMIIIVIGENFVRVNDIIVSGASFCHVDRISADNHDTEVITDGYHAWQGAIPILRIKAINNKTVI